MDVEWTDDESVESYDTVQFMRSRGLIMHDSVESDDDAVQFMEVEGTDRA
jgi:hypothetical protein